jgi:hypothetical protein
MFEKPDVKLKALRISCAKIACCSSKLIFSYLYAGSSIQNASEQFVSCVQLYFVNSPLRPNPTNKKCNEQIRTDSNSPISVTYQFSTHIHMHFLHTMTDTAIAQNFDVSF